MMAVKPMSFVAPAVGTLGLAPCVQGAPGMLGGRKRGSFFVPAKNGYWGDEKSIFSCLALSHVQVVRELAIRDVFETLLINLAKICVSGLAVAPHGGP